MVSNQSMNDPSAEPACFIFTPDNFDEMFDWLIDNTFFMFAGHAFKQNKGIAMGSNVAVLLANLYLHTYEFAFITQPAFIRPDPTDALKFPAGVRSEAFKNAMGAWRFAAKIMKHFMYTVRFLDDLLSIGNTYLTKLYDLSQIHNITVGQVALNIKGIYPCSVGGLEITITPASPNNPIYNHFMDVAFLIDFQHDKPNSQFITTSVYNKRHHSVLLCCLHTRTLTLTPTAHTQAN